MALKSRNGVLMDDSVWRKMRKNLLKGQCLNVKVGFFEDSVYGPENDNLYVAQVAQWNNEGAVNIPMRPFFYVYMQKLQTNSKMVEEMAPYIHQVAMGLMTWTQLYQRLGAELTAELKEVIKQWSTPPNSPFTVALKGKNDPLIDTGKMMESVNYRLGQGRAPT